MPKMDENFRFETGEEPEIQTLQDFSDMGGFKGGRKMQWLR
jgi:hypothetical protein